MKCRAKDKLYLKKKIYFNIQLWTRLVNNWFWQNYLLQIRKAIEEFERAKAEAEEREKYEAFLAQMIFELSELTALVFYPWVFKDEEGRHRDKYQSPPYLELINTLFKQNYDVLEELRVQLNEEMIESMFVESNVEITKELVAGVFPKWSMRSSKLSPFYYLSVPCIRFVPLCNLTFASLKFCASIVTKENKSKCFEIERFRLKRKKKNKLANQAVQNYHGSSTTQRYQFRVQSVSLFLEKLENDTARETQKP